MTADDRERLFEALDALRRTAGADFDVDEYLDEWLATPQNVLWGLTPERFLMDTGDMDVVLRLLACDDITGDS